MRRVVITGLAPVCALGYDHETVFGNLCDVRQNIVPIVKDNPMRQTLRTDYFVPYPEPDFSEYGDKMIQVRKRGAKSACLAVYAALKALEDSGMEKPDDDSMVFIGVGAPTMNEISRQVLKAEHTNKMDTMSVPMAMQSSIAAWISIVLGIHGKSSVISMACASGTETVGMGYENILNGRCDMAFCGGSDYLTDDNLCLLKGFEHLKAVTDSKDGRSLPFSKERSGFLFSEGGAAVVIVEELNHALARGAKIYAEITGFESSSDGFSVVSMYEDGRIIERMLRRLIGDKKVDYYNAHGTGTLLNDSVEARVIREIFGGKENQPAISATKALIGHTLGASGTIEVAVCADSILSNKVHGNICGTVMDDLNYTPETRSIQVDCAVSASFGFGGHNAAIMLERYRD
ncbi:MAG: beta-ketoacyl-[acyl-carrier-protein] synthase family protein [Ruminococcus flavefaciens]|nr:beta-ketoacyl-[acyl-carrier-protein] synthase family protein [Ruminococcus flavefaciens]